MNEPEETARSITPVLMEVLLGDIANSWRLAYSVQDGRFRSGGWYFVKTRTQPRAMPQMSGAKTF